MNPENADFTLQEESPCIDIGTTDLNGDGVNDITDFFGSAPDMGAFEFFAGSLNTGDLNSDNTVNVIDVVMLVEIILSGSNPSEFQMLVADINVDGIVNILDIVYLVNFILNNQTPTDIQFTSSDLNLDGLLNILDIVQLVNIIL